MASKVGVYQRKSKTSGRFQRDGTYKRVLKAVTGRRRSRGITTLYVDENNNISEAPFPIRDQKVEHAIYIDHDYCGIEHKVSDDCDIMKNSVSVDISTWSDGRRVVELGVIAEALKNGCSLCGKEIHFQDCEKESRYGLGSLLYIRCRQSACNNLTKVPTGKRHIAGQGNAKAWDVNTKLATAMLHSGIGEAKVNSFLTALNIPAVNHKTVKKKERKVGKIIEKVASESCEKSATEEQNLSQNSGKIAVAADAGWHTRASGRSYNSLSGHAALIGKETGKCVAYSTRNRYCRICDNPKKSSTCTEIEQHDCRKNWTGSSKSMEPDMCVEMLKKLEEKDIVVDTLIMDDDATTIAKCRSEVNAALKKQSDKNHTKRHLTNRLYSLRQTKKYKELNPRSIAHIGKCFSYAISQNKGNSAATGKAINSIVPHLFGTHDECDISWCNYLKNPHTYKPKNLPYSRNFNRQDLKEDMELVFREFATQSEKLCDLGSTQPNESLNNMVASKAPKSTFSSGSESNDFRVAAAVAQKNMGHSYVKKVNEEMLLSPGSFTEKRCDTVDNIRTKRKALEQAPAFKKKRLEKKHARFAKQESCETREGTTYQKNIMFSSDIVDEGKTLEIPPPSAIPTLIPLGPDSYSYIYFDLETTGLARDSDITQIAAVHGEELFSTYCIPQLPISPSATSVTGLAGMNGKLYKNGVEVSAKSLQQGIQDFLKWIDSFQKPILIAHNCKSFDSLVLCNSISKYSASNLENMKIQGFIDTLPFFKASFPGRKSYKQQHLVEDLLKDTYCAHDAVEDVRFLQKLCNSCENLPCLIDHSFSLGYCLEFISFSQKKEKNSKSLQILVDSKTITTHMKNKIVNSGLGYEHLELAHKRDSLNGIRSILTEVSDNSNNPRVTKNSKIINSIQKFFSEA